MDTADITAAIRNTYLAHSKAKTLEHAEQVTQTALWLADLYHLDPVKVKTAALLHDISVIMTPLEMYELAQKRGMSLDPAEEKYHFLLHQRISRLIAEEQFHLSDPAILSAVECHTTLKKSAGAYDKVIFIADKISWDREGVPPWYDELKRLAAVSLDEACYFYIRYQFDHNLLLMPHHWIAEACEDLKSTMCRKHKENKQMKIVNLNKEQVEDIEERLSAFDETYITYKMEGCIQIGIEDNGKLIAGLDACMTAFKILYVSTVFVDADYRRKGVGAMLIREMEKRAAEMGANTIRLDTFNWQGREFYEALGYEAVGHYENTEDGYEEFFFLKRIKPC